MKANDLMKDVEEKLRYELIEKAKRKIEIQINFIAEREKDIERKELFVKRQTEIVTRFKLKLLEMKAKMDEVFELPIEEYINYDFSEVKAIWYDDEDEDEDDEDEDDEDVIFKSTKPKQKKKKG